MRSATSRWYIARSAATLPRARRTTSAIGIVGIVGGVTALAPDGAGGEDRGQHLEHVDDLLRFVRGRLSETAAAAE